MEILFITSTRLGDGVLTTGILKHIVDLFPQSHVTIACGELCATLFNNLPQLKKIIILHKQPYNGHWLALWRQTIMQKWDLIVDLRASLISLFLRAKKHLYGPLGKKQDHVIRDLQNKFSLAKAPAPYIWLNTQERSYAEQLIGHCPYIVIGPTAGSEKKIWPWRLYLRLYHRLYQAFPQLKFAIAYGPKACEKSIARHFTQQIPHLLDLGGGQYSISQLSAIFERSRLFIGNDSGLMHVAAASNIPTLGLFGPSSAKRYHPWGTQSYWLCAPGKEGHAPITNLSDQQVFDKVVKILSHSS